MALTVAKVGTSLFSTSNVATYTWAAAAPPGNAGICVGVCNSDGTNAILPSLSSPSWLSGAWTQEATIRFVSAITRITLFSGRTIGSPASASLNALFGADAQTGCGIIVVSVEGEDETDFVLQPEAVGPAANGTSISETLDSPLAGSDSACLAFIAHQTQEAQTPTGGETELDDGGWSGPVREFSAQYEVNDTTSGASWATTAPRGILICELKAAAVAAADPPDGLPLMGVAGDSG